MLGGVCLPFFSLPTKTSKVDFSRSMLRAEIHLYYMASLYIGCSIPDSRVLDVWKTFPQGNEVFVNFKKTLRLSSTHQHFWPKNTFLVLSRPTLVYPFDAILACIFICRTSSLFWFEYLLQLMMRATAEAWRIVEIWKRWKLLLWI